MPAPKTLFNQAGNRIYDFSFVTKIIIFSLNAMKMSLKNNLNFLAYYDLCISIYGYEIHQYFHFVWAHIGFV